jgi:hypothetical protein
MGWKIEEISLIPEINSLPPVPKVCEELYIYILFYLTPPNTLGL